MERTSEKLTLGQISKDLNRVATSCDERAEESNKFHTEMRDSVESIHDTLKVMSEKLVGIENKMNPDHDDYILKETNEKMDQLWSLFQGLSFAGSAIKYTAGVVAGISVIIVSLFALIRYVK
jgi:hypothetical protein